MTVSTETRKSNNGSFLIDIDQQGLIDYLCRQIDNLFPDNVGNTGELIAQDIDEALDRLFYCMHYVKYWRRTGFHPLWADKNTVFLYYLANTIWRNRENRNLCEKLFYLNKALHGFHCMYYTELPDIFFVGHTLGVVLASIAYPKYLALHQNVTIGKNNDCAPNIEEGVVLFPGSAIIGNCHIRSRSYISINTSVVDRDTTGNCVVFADQGDIICKNPSHDILSDFFYFQ